jgi:hypothetical protein
MPMLRLNRGRWLRIWQRWLGDLRRLVGSELTMFSNMGMTTRRYQLVLFVNGFYSWSLLGMELVKDGETVFSFKKI